MEETPGAWLLADGIDAPQVSDPLAGQVDHIDCLCWQCYRNGKHLPTEITLRGVQAAVMDGTITMSEGKPQLNPLVAEQVADSIELDEAESARLKLEGFISRSDKGNTSYGAYRDDESHNGNGEYWRLCAQAARKAARLGLTNEQIARWLDIDVAHVDKCWTAAPTPIQQQARELFAEGFSVREVAVRTGLNHKTAGRLAEATGVTPRNGTVPARILADLDGLLAQGWSAIDAREFVRAKYGESSGRLTINNARVRASRMKKKMAAVA